MKTVIITGASSGLGRAFARGIQRVYPEIECCWLIARRKERLEELAAELEGLNCQVMALDVTSAEDISRFVMALREQKPEVELLINNAGFGILGDFGDSDISEQLGMIDLNVRALTAVTRAVLDYMPDGGRIINISSIASFVPTARMAVYSATKYYVRAFSRALSMELRPRKISVTAVCPGPMSTEFLEVARINGNSTAFRLLPRVTPERVALGSLRCAKRRAGVYTPGALYKFYRVISAIIPDSILMWLARA